MTAADIAIWATAAGLIAHIVGVIGYLSNRAKHRAEIEVTANTAMEEAREANKRANEAHDKLAMHIGHFAIYREQIARDYINRDSMREVETRLTTAMREMEGRLTTAIDQQGGRLDSALAGSHRGMFETR